MKTAERIAIFVAAGIWTALCLALAAGSLT